MGRYPLRRHARAAGAGDFAAHFFINNSSPFSYLPRAMARDFAHTLPGAILSILGFLLMMKPVHICMSFCFTSAPPAIHGHKFTGTDAEAADQPLAGARITRAHIQLARRGPLRAFKIDELLAHRAPPAGRFSRGTFSRTYET